VCHKGLEPIDDEEDEDSRAYQAKSLELEGHLTRCAALRGVKEAVESCFEEGQTMPCPGCGIAGARPSLHGRATPLAVRVVT